MTEPAFLTATRESYDTVAAAYVDRVPAPPDMEPLDRAMLAAFAEIVRASGAGPLVDVGCGPGRITAHLAEFGLTAIGIDLSPKMIELARRAHPALRFDVGTMTALDLADRAFGGVLAFFSTHHLPPGLLPAAFAEFHRVLVPGGHLMLGTHVGDDEHHRSTSGYGGLPVSYEWHLLPADHLGTLLEKAGFTVTARLTQKPADREYAYFFAHTPARG